MMPIAGIIEVLLEPEIKSPSNISLKDNLILPNNYDVNKLNILNKKNVFSYNVEKYLINFFKNKLQYNKINFKKLYKDIDDFLKYPSYEISKTAYEMKISHDDGKKGEISIIGDKDIIVHDLWPQANYKYFYNKDYSIGYINSLNKNIFEKRNNINIESNFVDIITRTMDRPFFLERALKSVQNQDYPNINHIIVVDGSDAKPIIKKINEIIDDPFNIKLICLKENCGMEAASNCGIENSNSEFILIHDDDDTLEKSFLSKTINFLIENKDLYKGVITHSNEVIEKIEKDKIKRLNVRPYNQHLQNIFFHDILQENTFPPISFLFFRECLDEIGLFNEQLPVLGDWDFNIRFLEKFEIGLITEGLANYHIRDISNNSTFGNSVNTGIDKHKKFQQIVRNNFFRRNPAYALTSLSKFQNQSIINQSKHFLKEFSNNKNLSNHLMEAYYKMVVIDVFENLIDESTIKKFKNMQLAELKTYLKPLLDNKELYAKSNFFDENLYLNLNKDIKLAVKNKSIKNGLYHYLIWGFFENRKIS